MNDRGWLVRVLPQPALRWAVGAVAFLGLAAMLLLRTTLVEPFRIPSAAMAPTVQVGDHVFVAKYRYGLQLPFIGVSSWRTPERGDIVVFRYPRDPSYHYIMRVVGLPEERISVQDNRVTVDGAVLAQRPTEERYAEPDASCLSAEVVVAEETVSTSRGLRSYPVLRNKGLAGPLARMPEIVVPPGHVFVMGDNRDSAEDSRRFGAVPITDVIGQAQTVWFSFDTCTGKVRSRRFGTSVGAVTGEALDHG